MTTWLAQPVEPDREAWIAWAIEVQHESSGATALDRDDLEAVWDAAQRAAGAQLRDAFERARQAFPSTMGSIDDDLVDAFVAACVTGP